MELLVSLKIEVKCPYVSKKAKPVNFQICVSQELADSVECCG